MKISKQKYILDIPDPPIPPEGFALTGEYRVSVDGEPWFSTSTHTHYKTSATFNPHWILRRMTSQECRRKALEDRFGVLRQGFKNVFDALSLEELYEIEEIFRKFPIEEKENG